MSSSVPRAQRAVPAWLERTPAIAGVTLVCVAALVTAALALDVPAVAAGWRGLPPLKLNVALALVLAGVSLMTFRRGPRGRALSTATAILVLLIGGATLVEYVTGFNFGLDEMLARDRYVLPGFAPGRMAFLAAVGLTFAGTNLLLLRSRVPFAVTDVLSYAVAITALPALMAYAYDIEAIEPARLPGTPMALTAALSLLLLAFALAVARPESPRTRLLASRGTGGMILRRLLPLAVGIPFVTGSLLLHAHQAGYLGNIEIIVLFAAANIIVLGGLVLWNAIAAERAEFSRLRLAAIVESSSDAIIGKDLNGRITLWNAGAEALYGYSAGEAVGQPVSIVIPPEGQPEHQALLRRVVEGEAIVDHEAMRVRKDGVPVAVSLSLSPIRDTAGSTIGISAIARDVTERRLLEHVAREAESRFRALVEQALVGVYVVQGGRFAYVNRKMADIFGYTPDEMLALPSVMEIVEASDRAKVTEYIDLRLSTGRSVHYEARGRRKDGSTLYAEVHGGVLDNGTRRLIGMLHDITDRKIAQDALAESEARLKEAQSVAHVGSWELDLRSGVLHWSDEVYRIFGMEPQAFGATYEYFLQRIHPEDRELVNSAYSTSVATRGSYSIDHRVVLSDGTLKFVHERCATHYDENGHAIRSVGTVHDVTERKLAEEALNRLNNELESRVEQRTAELRAANQELEAFSYSVSHDLRAPLRALQGFSRLLLEEHLPDLSTDAARYIGIIRDNAAQMGVLIDDLLNFSRLSRQPVRSEQVDVRALTAQALNQLEHERAGRQVDIRFGELPTCSGDPALLRQVMLNLLSNALKFTRGREDAVIEIGTCRALGNGREHVYFVKDNGAGFDMQYSAKLFGIFQRLHSASEYEGTGVGLAIVQRILRRHGGRIWPEAAPGRGATFYFSLPKGTPDGTDGR